MKAVVVYESHWGNTAAIARAIASGLGPDTPVLATEEATGAALADAELIVAGAPVIAFRLATDSMRESIAEDVHDAPTKPDVTHPSMRDWLDGLSAGKGLAAAFETRLHWSPGGATSAIERGLQTAGYARVAKGHKFFVTGRYGPLRDGELDAARAWGSELARVLQATTGVAAAQ
jgi:flavorubredoxin